MIPARISVFTVMPIILQTGFGIICAGCIHGMMACFGRENRYGIGLFFQQAGRIKFDIVCGDVYNKTITAMTERVDD